MPFGPRALALVKPVYTRLVLSGGETRGLAQLGVLHYFWENEQISQDSLTHFAGTSVGSLIALLLVCGYTPFEIWTHICEADAVFYKQPRSPWSELLSGFGFMAVEGILGKVEELVRQRYDDAIPSLRELYEHTEKVLVIAVTNVTFARAEYCSYKYTPNLSCLAAVKASCNVPGIFRKIEREGSSYVDGGVLDNFPLYQIDDGRSPLLGVTFLPETRDDTKFLEYMSGIVFLPIYALTRRTIREAGTNCRVLELPVQSLSPLEFVVDAEKRRALFVAGYRAGGDVRMEIYLKVPGYTARDRRTHRYPEPLRGSK